MLNVSIDFSCFRAILFWYIFTVYHQLGYLPDRGGGGGVVWGGGEGGGGGGGGWGLLQFRCVQFIADYFRLITGIVIECFLGVKNTVIYQLI